MADTLGLAVVPPQARLEVHRFGITGYGKGKERVLERERAIMLGAKVRGGRWPGLGEGTAQGPGAAPLLLWNRNDHVLIPSFSLPRMIM